MNVSPHILPDPIRRGLHRVLPESGTAFWFPLGGGRTNRCWRGDGVGGPIVVKLFAPEQDNPLFPNNPKQEADMLRQLCGYGLAPELLAEFETPLGRCIVYRHVDGAPWTSGAFDVGQVMRRLHRRPAPAGLRRVDISPVALEQQALVLSDRARCLLPLLPPKSRLDPTPPVFLHGDIVAGNLIRSPAGLTLIDWQAPGSGDACHDISVFLSPAMMMLYRGTPLGPGEIDGFFNGYGSDETRERYRLLAPWLHLRLFAYCLWKADQGDRDYRLAADAERVALDQSLACYPSQSLIA